ncbi:unnamed protein product [Lampetra fluviatilis]
MRFLCVEKTGKGKDASRETGLLHAASGARSPPGLSRVSRRLRVEAAGSASAWQGASAWHRAGRRAAAQRATERCGVARSVRTVGRIQAQDDMDLHWAGL